MWQALEALVAELESVDDGTSGDRLVSLDEQVRFLLESSRETQRQDPERAGALLARLQAEYRRILGLLEKAQAENEAQRIRAQQTRRALKAYLDTHKPTF